MIKGIDHLVVVVNDLDKAARDYEDLSFTVVPGGRHPVGSHNVLIAFADGSYIEIIAFYREATDHRWWEPLKKGERLVDYCLQTDDLRGDTGKFRAAGVDISDPVPWARTRPDGYEVKWRLSLARGGHRGIAPFLIEDITPREERVPQIFQHKNGATGIGAVKIAVGESSAVPQWYQAVLGNEGEPIGNAQPLGAKGRRFRVGMHALDFLMPVHPGNPLVHWMRTYGPSPYAASLRGSRAAGVALDPALSHGANFSFEP